MRQVTISGNAVKCPAETGQSLHRPFDHTNDVVVVLAMLALVRYEILQPIVVDLDDVTLGDLHLLYIVAELTGKTP